MEIIKLKSISDELYKYDYLKNKEDKQIIYVTEWENGEGWDICIMSDNTKMFNLTMGELDAINYLTKSLEYNNEKL